MSNLSYLILAILLVAAVAADVILFDSENVLFLAKKIADLIEWLAFWR